MHLSKAGLRAAVVLAVATASTARAATPILWYKLDETSGAVAADSSGAGNTGTYVGGPTLGAAGMRRNAVYFPANGQYVTAAASASLNAIGAANADFSVAFWVKPNGTNGAWRPMFHKGSADTERGPGVWLNPGNNRVHFRISTSANWNEGTDSVADLPNGTWSHIACVKAGNKWRCYVNGVLDTELTLAGATVGNSGPVYIGDDPWYTGCPAWMDDVRVFSSALTDAEVKSLFGVVGYWKLDESSGTSAADSTNAGNTGTYSNGPALNQAGLVDNAVTFDGTDDYVTVAGSGSLVASDAVTMSAWVRPAASANIDRIIINKEGEYELGLSDANEVKWAIANASPGWAWHQTGCFLTNGKWAHIVVSYDGVEVRTYVDGALVETYAASGTITDVYPALNELRIGGRSNSPAGKNFAGKIDDVHLYTRAVTPSEVASLHGLVGCWKVDEGAGTAISDSTLNAGSAAFASGAPSWVPGMRLSALSFNGTTDDAATNQNFTPPSTGSMAFWFKSNATPTGPQRLCGLGDNWEVWEDAGGIIRFDLCGDGGSGGFLTTSPVSAGRWYHVVAVFDSATDAYSVYVDGELQKTGVSTSGLVAQAAAKLSFGTRTGTTERFAGQLDDFRVYNRKLNPWEVYELYGLVGWYKLDETGGTVTLDSTGIGNDGSFNGSPALGTPSNGNGVLGTCVTFNGSNNVQIPTLFGKSPSVSITGWAKFTASDASGAEFISLGDCFALRLQSGSPGVKTFFYNGSGWPMISASQTVLNTGWHHYAAVLDQAGTIKLYLDGALASSGAAAAISYSGLGSSSWIAAHGNGQTTYDFSGSIDDVRIYNRIMQPDEVSRLYDGSRVRGVRILKWVEVR